MVEEGGYDLCSDTKAKPLMWRRFAEEFVGKNQYTAAQAFQIKNVYYKNLCAYEISNHWNKEPPPKEILEEVTAKGGNVMTRTLENFAKPPTKEERNLANDDDASDESPGQKTPKQEATDGAEEPGSAAGRTSRLRQAPPQRVLFQPDLTAQGRQTRGQANPSASPAPGINGAPPAGMMNGTSATLAGYEPSQSYPLSLKPVVTPANNPDYYRQQLKRKAESAMGPIARKYRNIMLPGTGFIGPNIYVRAQLALQSGIEQEEQYALHHLVKISHERGDKYRFDQFPGLAEALVKKAMQVCGLFYDVEWDVSYEDETMDGDDEILNGLSGTSDIVRRLRQMVPRATEDNLQEPAFASQLDRVMEAGLILRNMSLQAENAKYLFNMPTTRDYLAVVLNLPQHPAVIELQHYALDTAEQVLVWCDLGPKDALYQALIRQLYGQDRGAIVLALRTLARIAMNLAGPKRLDEIPAAVLRKVQNWLLVEDEELKSACLDFLFQYTSFSDNVANLLDTVDSTSLAHHLSRLLLFAAKENREIRPFTARQDPSTLGPHPIPCLSKSVISMLLALDEPERSSEWLRMCFLADRDSDMTQISLWQAYQSTFAPYAPTHPHLVAGEFIKNVSNTFAGATAQVAGSNKYVIKGIRARQTPVMTGLLRGSGGKDKGRELAKCRWSIMVPSDPVRDPITGVLSGGGMREGECSEWFWKEGDLLKHVLRDHVQVPARTTLPPKAEDPESMDVDSRPSSAMANGAANGKASSHPFEQFDFEAADKATLRCRWGGCKKSSADFASSLAGGKQISRTALFARHIRTHLPDPSTAEQSKPSSPPETAREAAASERVTYQGLADEKNDATGVALNAALVLRNIAKFMPGVEDSRADAGKKPPREERMVDRVFDEEVVERLSFALTFARPVGIYVGSVLRALGRIEV